MEKLELEVNYTRGSGEKLYIIEASPTLMDRIKEAQESDQECVNMTKRILDGEDVKYKFE